MIEWMRKHMGWLMWIIVVLVTIAFVFTFGNYPTAFGGKAVAKVGNSVITSEELNQAYRNLYENYKGLLKDKFNDTVAKSLRKQALQELIVNQLLVAEAKRIGLKVSDKELQTEILQMPAFNRNGKFDKQVYDRVLDRINMTPAQFEASQREFLLRQKLESLVKAGVVVEEPELKAAYAARNPKAKPGDFAKNKDTFGQMYLAEKQRDALTALIRNIETKISVTVEDKALTS
jgi:parvulin-like peptidyl-prolyl isomerase